MRALEALNGPAPASVGGRRGRPPASSASPTTAAARRGGAKRAPRGQRRDQVVAALQGAEKGPSEIAREIGVNPTQISGLLRQLAAEGRVMRTDSGKWTSTGAGPLAADASPAAAIAPGPANGAGAHEPGPAPFTS